jgi:hypothetical protein
MSNIVPFIPRAAGGDWTAGERERLAELAGKLTSSGAHVDAAYGVSDAGDPWCVITDEEDEVLIHVARIDGQFVIHDAADDAVQAEDNLWSAFERLMGPGWRGAGDDDMVVPMRQAQSVLALVAALLFVGEIAHVANHAPHEDIPHAPHPADGQEMAALTAPSAGHDAAATTTAAQVQTSEDSSPRRQALIARAAEPPADTGPAQAAAPAPAGPALLHEPVSPMALAESAPAFEPGRLLVAGDGGESLIGGTGGGHLVGGAGNDTLIGGGARPGEIDLLEGGAGDDRIMLGARTVAVGGEGHDTFVVQTQPLEPKVQAPEGTTAPVATGGVILDFTPDDRIDLSTTGKIVSVTANVDVLAGLHGFTSLARQPVTPGVTVGIDLDGDGRADTYLFVAGSGTSSLTVTAPTKAASPPEPTDHEATVTLSGASHDAGDLLLG